MAEIALQHSFYRSGVCNSILAVFLINEKPVIGTLDLNALTLTPWYCSARPVVIPCREAC